MNTYHIHISGLVQGVGFRPFVCQVAEKMNVYGWVSNTTDGVHIEFNATAERAALFYTAVIDQPPVHAVITGHQMRSVPFSTFTSFAVRQNVKNTDTHLLLTPDLATCDECKRELTGVPGSRRAGYAFTTCLHCGPRYSIITSLPYEREHTTMANLEMCEECRKEYDDITNKRNYSQTNSCDHCAIEMRLYKSPAGCISTNSEEILSLIDNHLRQNNIIAVKGIGGYLLLCDAGSEAAIATLRRRKQRPQKPFAVLYPDIAMAGEDVHLGHAARAALQSPAAPVVLCRLKKKVTDGIAPGLDTLGVMLPYSPLLLLIATRFGRPMIATSANISGIPILYKDEDALTLLPDIADLVLTFDREIITPQDDSVVRFTKNGQQIVLRRGRGMAPHYLPAPGGQQLLAMGAELKSTFALSAGGHILTSQYLGHHGTLESHKAFTHALQHVLQLLKISPDHILIDQHPGYFSALLGAAIAKDKHLPLTAFQHHKAHFAAVLTEHDLLHHSAPILGIIWDGAGYGEDGQVWGGEAFIYDQYEMKRVAHLDYFPQLMGDKMSREPRLSALALLPEYQQYFSAAEWKYYQQLLQQPGIQTSSMGRLLDGIAAILGVTGINTYEGEAAMKLEALAGTAETNEYYTIGIMNGRIRWQDMLSALLPELRAGMAVNIIARKVFCSLAHVVAAISEYTGVKEIAFSGGVFQSALLTDMIITLLPGNRQLYFHRELSPNDECISVGQIALFNCNEYKC